MHQIGQLEPEILNEASSVHETFFLIPTCLPFLQYCESRLQRCQTGWWFAIEFLLSSSGKSAAMASRVRSWRTIAQACTLS